jgi:hypothetical protein
LTWEGGLAGVWRCQRHEHCEEVKEGGKGRVGWEGGWSRCCNDIVCTYAGDSRGAMLWSGLGNRCWAGRWKVDLMEKDLYECDKEVYVYLHIALLVCLLVPASRQSHPCPHAGVCFICCCHHHFIITSFLQHHFFCLSLLHHHFLSPHCLFAG